MTSRTFRFPVIVALVAAMMAAVVVLLALGHSQAGASQAGVCADPTSGGGELSFEGIGTPNHTSTVEGDVCPDGSEVWTFSTLVVPLGQYIGVRVDEKAGSVLVSLLLPDGDTVSLEPGEEYRALYGSHPRAFEVTISATGSELAGYRLLVCRSIIDPCVFSFGEPPPATPLPPPATLTPTATTTPLPPPAPPSGSGSMAVDCDATQAGVQSDCIHAPGSTFQVEVHVTEAPAGGYGLFQVKLEWTKGVLNYLPTVNPRDEALWGACTLAARINNWEQSGGPSVFFSCNAFPPLSVGDTTTGAVLTFEMQCKNALEALSPPAGLDPGQSVLHLVPAPDVQGGTRFGDVAIRPIDPALTDATVTCAGEPVPTPTPLSPPATTTPLPPPATPSSSGSMAVDCDATQAGVQSDCIHAPGASFQVEVHVTEAPAGGYGFFQVKLEWTNGVLNYLPTVDPADEALWGPCTIAARLNNWEQSGVPSVFFVCAPLPSLSAGDTTTGAVLTFEMQCKSAPEGLSPPAGLDPGQSVLHLVPFPDAQGGTRFGDVAIVPVDPALTGATVTCAGEPVPTPTPLSPPARLSPPATPVPAPTTEPSAPVFAGSFEDIFDFYGDSAPDCGGGTLALTLTQDRTGIVALSVVGFNVGGEPNDNVMEFDPPLTIETDGTFFGSGPFPPTLTIAVGTLEGAFDFAADPATVAGSFTISLADNPSVVFCQADFTAGPPPDTDGAPVPTPPPLSPPAPIPLGPPGPSGSINGTVSAEETGTPLADICIFVGDADFVLLETMTDASGNYSVGGLSSGEYLVAFIDCISATYVTEWYDDQPDFSSADLVTVTDGVKTGGIDAALVAGGSINGTVTEEGTGDPLAEICVDVVDTSFTFFGSAVTDASGNYTVGGLSSGDYRVQFSNCGSGIHIGEWYDDEEDFSAAHLVAVTEGVKTGGIDAALAVGGSINGKVTEEETGTPLAEICVFVVDTSFVFFESVTTDASGNYSVGGLTSGDYLVAFIDCLLPVVYLTEIYNDRPDAASADLVAVTQGVKTGGIDAALAVGGSISGTVTEKGTGDPLAEICVDVIQGSFSFSGSAVTDASGNYTVGGLGSADYRVQFSNCGSGSHIAEWYDDQPDFSSADLVAVTQGVKTGGIDAALALGGSINGTVTEEGTGDPLAQICVSVEDTLHTFFDTVRTDSSGAYSVGGLPTDDYTVGFFDCASGNHLSEWYDDQRDFSSADPVAVTQGVKTAGIDAALAVAGSINGTVTEEGTGDPLAQICVFVIGASDSFFGFGFTDGSGNYSVGGLLTGDYTVQFSNCGSGNHVTEWYDNQPGSSSADLVAVTEGVKTGGIDAALAVGGSINGTVTVEGTGAPLPSICVFVQDTSQNFLGFGFTDGSGNYSVGGLPSGDHAVEFSDCEHGIHVTEWYDDQPDFASADLVAVIQEMKTEGIDAALVDSTAPTPTPTPVPGALIFEGSFEEIYDFDGDTTPECGGGDITITVDPAGPEIVSLEVGGFSGWGSPNDNGNVRVFDPRLPIAGDGSFSSSFLLPAPGILATFAGTFDSASNPTTVSGSLTIALAINPSIVLCAADFTAGEPPVGAPTPTATPTATPEGSSGPEATGGPSLPETGAGALATQRGAGAGLWAMIGALLVASAAGLALFGRRSLRSP